MTNNMTCRGLCEDFPDPGYVVNSLEMIGLQPMSCGEIDFLLRNTTMGCDEKLNNQLSVWCGCDTVLEILGTSSKTDQRILNWIPRVTGLLSILGSCAIIWDVVKQSSTRTNRYESMLVYQEILTCFSAFDIIGSLSWIVGAAATPTENEYGDQFGWTGAFGNTATCKAQGFFAQLGLTGVMYNFSLSLYYVLVICCGWKEFQVRKISPFLHIPAVVGLTLALVGLPYYENSYLTCIPRELAHYTITAPVVIVVGTIVLSMVAVFRSVYKRTHDSRTWRSNNSFASTPDSGNNDHQVLWSTFWQCVCYAGAFCITWPFLLTALVLHRENPMSHFLTNFGFWVAVVVFSPVQGFLNALVYYRPRWLAGRRKRQKSTKVKNIERGVNVVVAAFLPVEQPQNSSSQDSS